MIIQRLTKVIQQQSFTIQYLVKGFSFTLLLRMLGIGMGFLSTLVLAWFLGADKYGTFTYLFSWLTLLGSLATIGFNVLLIRQIAVYEQIKNVAAAKGLALFSGGISLLIALMFSTLLYFICIHLNIEKLACNYFNIDIWWFSEIENKRLLKWAIWGIVFWTLLKLTQALLLGGKHIISGQIGEVFVKPLILLSIVLIIYCVNNQSISLFQVVVANVVAIALTLVLVVVLVYKKNNIVWRKTKAKYTIKPWLLSASSFFFISAISLVNVRADILMLGALAGNVEVGIYNIAAKLSEMLKLCLVVFNVAFAPLVASLFSDNKLQEIQKIVTKSTRIIVLLGLPVAIFLLVFGAYILKFWGNDFMLAHRALCILCIAQLVNLACGPVGLILSMTAYENEVIKALFVSTLINISLNAWLIPLYTINGAAIATGTSVVVLNLMLVYQLLKRLNIDPTFWGFLQKNNNKGDIM